jgi:hypothetical protein
MHAQRRSRWPLAVVSLVVTFAIEAWLNRPLAIAPGGIVGLELARTPAAAQQILDMWSAADLIGRARTGVWFDYAYLAAYGWFFREMVLLEWWTRAAAVDAWFARLPIVAAAFDAVENIGLLMVLGGRVTLPWTTLAAVFAALKFVLIACTVIYLVTGIIVLAVRGRPAVK